MKRTLLAIAAIGLAIPAHAAPPTVTPSPGYDARLQEQRSATSTAQPPVAPVVTPAAPSRKGKKKPHTN